MKLPFPFIILLLGLCILPVSGQSSNVAWQRVTTGDDFVVDLDESSLTFKPYRILEARFRTEYSKAETLAGDPPVKYKARIDTIQFSTAEHSYRIFGVSLLDSRGKIVRSETADENRPWKQIGLGTSSKLFTSLDGLAPLGPWAVSSYRIAGDTRSHELADSPEFSKLLDLGVVLAPRHAQIGKRRCSAVSYESRKLDEKDLERMLGVSTQGLGISADPVDVIAVKCESKEWQPEQSMILRIAPAKMLMLWGGVFIELVDKRQKSSFPLPKIGYDDGTKTLQVQKPN